MGWVILHTVEWEDQSKYLGEGEGISRNWATSCFLTFHGQFWKELSWHWWACHSAYANILETGTRAQGLLEDESSTILGLVGFNHFLLYPVFSMTLPFFQWLCFVLFLPVSNPTLWFMMCQSELQVTIWVFHRHLIKLGFNSRTSRCSSWI